MSSVGCCSINTLERNATRDGMTNVMRTHMNENYVSHVARVGVTRRTPLRKSAKWLQLDASIP